MSNTYCTVCGETWDYYSARHGDMEKWEFELFRKGAGCPSCEGVTDKPFEPTKLAHIEFGDEDGLERLLSGDRPKWEKPPEPEPEKLWECDGCGVHVVRDSEGELAYDLPPNAPGKDWCKSHPFHRESKWIDIGDEPYHVFAEGQKACEFCVSFCDNCGKEICETIDFGDVYIDGASLASDDYSEAYCIDCFESLAAEEEEEEEDE